MSHPPYCLIHPCSSLSDQEEVIQKCVCVGLESKGRLGRGLGGVCVCWLENMMRQRLEMAQTADNPLDWPWVVKG